jgi:hypothetical protein
MIYEPTRQGLSFIVEALVIGADVCFFPSKLSAQDIKDSQTTCYHYIPLSPRGPWADKRINIR